MTKPIEEWQAERDRKPLHEMKLLAGIMQEKFEGASVSMKYESDGVAVNRNMEDPGAAVIAMFGGMLAMTVQCLADGELDFETIDALNDLLNGTQKAVDDIVKHKDEITLKESHRDMGTVREILEQLPPEMREKLARDIISKMFGN